jgi:hypothetical protein
MVAQGRSGWSGGRADSSVSLIRRPVAADRERVIVDRWLHDVEPRRRTPVVVTLAVTTWGALGTALLVGPTTGAVWLAVGVVTAVVLRNRARVTPARTVPATGPADDALPGRPARRGATESSLEDIQARVLARLRAESGDPLAEPDPRPGDRG